MIGYFPQVLDDELLYALLARHRRHSGVSSATVHMRVLYGRRSAIASFDMPCALDELSRSIGIKRLDGRTLAQDHSLLSYYGAFTTEEEYEDALQGLLVGDAASVRHRLGLSAWSIRPVERPRVCPMCAQQQAEALDEFTLLRSHQLPGSLVCHLHGTGLNEYAGPLPLGSRHDFVLPALGQFRPILVEQAYAAEGRPLLVRIAREQARLLRTGTVRPVADYRADLERLGLMRSAKKVDQRALSEAIEELYRPILRYLPAAARSIGQGGWPEAMSRSLRKAVHPLLHTLFAIFIEDREGRPRVARSRDPRVEFGAGPWCCRNPLADHCGRSVIRTVEAYRNKGAIVGVFHCDCGYVYTRGISRSGNLGPPRFRRGGPLLDEFLRTNVRPGASLRGLAKQARLDPKSLVRLAEGLGLDFDWTTRASGRPEVRMPVTGKEPAKRTGRNRTAKPRVDWVSRDRELTVRIRHAVDNVLAERPPLRLTFAELERRVSRPGWLRKRRDKLPCSIGLIEASVETTEAFRRRRILLAAATDPAAPAWKIMRRAGVGSIGLVHEVLKAGSKVASIRRSA